MEQTVWRRLTTMMVSLIHNHGDGMVVYATTWFKAKGYMVDHDHTMVLPRHPRKVVHDLMATGRYETGIYGVDDIGEWVSLS